MVQGGNAWDAQSFNGKFGSKGRQDRDEYFEKDDEGHFQLKDGYEQRSLGSSSDDLGAKMVYSNDYDDLESPGDARYYGIYEVNEPASPENPVAPPTPTEEPEAPKQNLPTSQKVLDARAGVNDFETNSLGSQGDQLFAQGFKDEYQSGLLDDLKAADPQLLNETKQSIEEKDMYNTGLRLS